MLSGVCVGVGQGLPATRRGAQGRALTREVSLVLCPGRGEFEGEEGTGQMMPEVLRQRGFN